MDHLQELVRNLSEGQPIEVHWEVEGDHIVMFTKVAQTALKDGDEEGPFMIYLLTPFGIETLAWRSLVKGSKYNIGRNITDIKVVT